MSQKRSCKPCKSSQTRCAVSPFQHVIACGGQGVACGVRACVWADGVQITEKRSTFDAAPRDVTKVAGFMAADREKAFQEWKKRHSAAGAGVEASAQQSAAAATVDVAGSKVDYLKAPKKSPSVSMSSTKLGKKAKAKGGAGGSDKEDDDDVDDDVKPATKATKTPAGKAKKQSSDDEDDEDDEDEDGDEDDDDDSGEGEEELEFEDEYEDDDDDDDDE